MTHRSHGRVPLQADSPPTPRMNRGHFPLLWGLLALTLTVSCITTTPRMEWTFLHRRDRLNFGLKLEQLRDLRFYISEEVRLKSSAPPGPVQVETHLVIAPKLAEGRVVEVGPNWLRVRFTEGGNGAYFLTDVSKPDDYYWLATTIEGEGGLYRLADLDPVTFMIDGITYEVIHGKWANLRVDAEGWQKLMDRHKIPPLPDPPPATEDRTN